MRACNLDGWGSDSSVDGAETRCVSAESTIRSSAEQSATMADQIPAGALDREVTGPGIITQPLAELLSGGPALLVFLRHFG